jgi:FkbM family methyltransferase
MVAKTWATDLAALDYIFLRQVHGRLFDDCVVIDLGGNRGYLGAYALLNGALAVYSYEPNSGNYETLRRCASSFDQLQHPWKLERCAVADRDGEIDLNISENSWHHSIYTPTSEMTDAIERVPVRSFSAIVEEVRSAHPREPIAVEMTVEGAETDVILGTPVPAWEEVSSLMFDGFSRPDRVPQLLEHLSRSGLLRSHFTHASSRRPVIEPWVLVTRRAERLPS